jgi:hypothetical protein
MNIQLLKAIYDVKVYVPRTILAEFSTTYRILINSLLWLTNHRVAKTLSG